MTNTPCPCRFNEPLAPYTTFKIGGPADVVLLPRDVDEFIGAVRWAGEAKLPVSVLGGGSNVLIADGGIAGAVVVTTGLASVSFDGAQVTAAAGVDMSRLVEECVEHDLAGLENFYGMPGTIGGAVFMNARCYGRSVAETISVVNVTDATGEVRQYPASECGFANKGSRFQSGTEWIVQVRLTLTPAKEREQLRTQMHGFRRQRQELGQFQFPNAGCVFKNNYALGEPTGKVIDRLGLRGRRCGQAQVFLRHANFVVNLGGATAAEVLTLVREMEAAVLEKTGVRLEREIRLLGRWGS